MLQRSEMTLLSPLNGSNGEGWIWWKRFLKRKKWVFSIVSTSKFFLTKLWDTARPQELLHALKTEYRAPSQSALITSLGQKSVLQSVLPVAEFFRGIDEMKALFFGPDSKRLLLCWGFGRFQKKCIDYFSDSWSDLLEAFMWELRLIAEERCREHFNTVSCQRWSTKFQLAMSPAPRSVEDALNDCGARSFW